MGDPAAHLTMENMACRLAEALLRHGGDFIRHEGTHLALNNELLLIDRGKAIDATLYNSSNVGAVSLALFPGLLYPSTEGNVLARTKQVFPFPAMFVTHVSQANDLMSLITISKSSRLISWRPYRKVNS
jgi:hypothetical protein